MGQIEKIIKEILSEIFVFKKIMDLLYRATHTMYGWLLAIMAFFANILSPNWYCFAVVLTAILLDAFFGILVALKKKKFLLSKLARVTLLKISSYGACLIMTILIEKIIHNDGLVIIKGAAALAAACEFWSMSASILIVWPEAVFFRLFRRQLKGEIASKLGKDVDDILPE